MQFFEARTIIAVAAIERIVDVQTVQYSTAYRRLGISNQINLLNKRTDRPLTLICMKYI